VEPSALTASGSPVRLLVVADYPPLVKALRSLMEEEGWAVDVPGSDGNPSELIARGGYDLLVLDVKRPGEPALSAVQSWCQTCPQTPILVLTPPQGPGDLAPVVSAWVAKPFALDDLLNRIRVLLTNSATSPPPTSHNLLPLDLPEHGWESLPQR